MALRHRYEAHFEAWRHINAAAEERQLAKLHLVQAQCDSLKVLRCPVTPPELSTDNLSEMETLRQQMIALSSQMEKQAHTHSAQLRQAEVMHEQKMQQWKLHCDGISAESSLLRASLPPAAEVMDKDETQLRKDHVAAVRADTPPPPSVGGAAAGSGSAEKLAAADGHNY